MDSNKSNPTLGIVVPVSSMAGKLNKLEEWVARTEGLPVEIVLVHDFKDQQTQKELENLVAGAHQIPLRLFRVEYGNPGETRNFGLEKISAKWVQFADSDDELDVASSLKAIDAARIQSEILVTNYLESSLINSEERILRHGGSLLRVSLNPGVWRMIFKRDLLSNVRFSKHRMGEDQLFLLDLDFYHRNLEFSDLFTYKYFTGNENQLTNNRRAISEIKALIFEISEKYSTLIRKNDKYASIMIARLILTLLKLESSDSVKGALLLLFKILNRFSFMGRISVIRSLFVVYLRRIS